VTTNHPPVIRQRDQGRTIGVMGDVYRFLAVGEETDGKYCMFEALVPPGGGPPPHVHSREEEAFYVLEGEIAFYLGDVRHLGRAGMFFNMPVGCGHCFKNESDKPARMLITVAPAGLEKMFFEIAQPVAPGAPSAPPPTQEIIARLIAIAPRYGIEIMLPKQSD
jgi:quercetin dioxygenase-like cupin family protein